MEWKGLFVNNNMLPPCALLCIRLDFSQLTHPSHSLQKYTNMWQHVAVEPRLTDFPFGIVATITLSS